MDLWTVQSKEVLKICEKYDVYMPDIRNTRRLYDSEELNNKFLELIRLARIALYKRNQIPENQDGNDDMYSVVFAFANINFATESVVDMSYEEFQSFISSHYFCIKSLWESFPDDSVILKLNVFDGLDPCFMDINDWQYIMPPITVMTPFTAQSAEQIISRMCNEPKTVYESVLPSGVYQALLPGIAYENIVDVYPMFKPKSSISEYLDVNLDDLPF